MANSDKASSQLITVNYSEHPLSEQMESWVSLLRDSNPQLTWVVRRSSDLTPPTIKIGNKVTYQAVPEGAERSLFNKAIGIDKLDACPFDLDLQERIKVFQVPHEMVLFIANQCHYCPQVVGKMLHYVALSPQAGLTIIDAQQLSDVAAKENIKSVPTLILDGHMRMSGQIDVNEVVAYIQNRDPSQLTTDTLAVMIHDGQADRLAAMMLSKGSVFDAFSALLTNPKWSIRLGAMVVMEHLIEEDTNLVSGYLMQFWDRWGKLDQDVQGDLLYLMGETKNPIFFEPIQAMIHTPDLLGEELLSAAQDALESLDDR
jgi:hypothetical protein